MRNKVMRNLAQSGTGPGMETYGNAGHGMEAYSSMGPGVEVHSNAGSSQRHGMVRDLAQRHPVLVHVAVGGVSGDRMADTGGGIWQGNSRDGGK